MVSGYGDKKAVNVSIIIMDENGKLKQPLLNKKVAVKKIDSVILPALAKALKIKPPKG